MRAKDFKRTRQKSLIIMNTRTGKCINLCLFYSLILVLQVHWCQLLLPGQSPHLGLALGPLLSLGDHSYVHGFEDPTQASSSPRSSPSKDCGLPFIPCPVRCLIHNKHSDTMCESFWDPPQGINVASTTDPIALRTSLFCMSVFPIQS